MRTKDRAGFRDPEGVIGYIAGRAGEQPYLTCPDPKCRGAEDVAPIYAANVRPYNVTCVRCKETIYHGVKATATGADLIFNGT